MIFNFVVDRDYENISTTKFSRFTVAAMLLYTCIVLVHAHRVYALRALVMGMVKNILLVWSIGVDNNMYI